jgi:hypothetical protein
MLADVGDHVANDANPCLDPSTILNVETRVAAVRTRLAPETWLPLRTPQESAWQAYESEKAPTLVACVEGDTCLEAQSTLDTHQRRSIVRLRVTQSNVPVMEVPVQWPHPHGPKCQGGMATPITVGEGVLLVGLAEKQKLMIAAREWQVKGHVYDGVQNTLVYQVIKLP